MVTVMNGKHAMRYLGRFGASVLGALAILGTTAATAADKVTVHMATPSPASMPYLIADAAGYYKDNGIDFDGRVMQTSIGVMAAVSGDVDVTQILGLSLRGAIQKGAGLKIVMIFNTLPTYSLFAAKGIKSYDDLKGKTVASTSIGASASKVLFQELRENGLDAKKDLTIFYVGDSATCYQVLLSGRADAAVIIPPFDINAREKGFTSLPFGNKPGMLMGGVSASTKFLEQRPEVARRFLRATWQGLREFKTNRSGSIEIMAKTMKIDADKAGKIYDAWIDRISDHGFESREFVDGVLNFEFGKTSEEMRSKSFDFSILRSVAAK
jgi:NitT/TauT family transport system substrate-binding protein